MTNLMESLMTSERGDIIKEDGNVYRLSIYGRGEHLFFRENDKGLLCHIDAVHGAIFKKSIHIWDSTGEKMSKAEKERVSELIFKYYKKFYNPNVIWVDKFC